jgi:alpha-glucosidase (family GH31 glycosyl hydrolase)
MQKANSHMIPSFLVSRSRFAAFAAMGCTLLVMFRCAAQPAGIRITEDAESFHITTSNYQFSLTRKGFRYSVHCLDPVSQPVPAHASSGLEFGGGPAVETTVQSSTDRSVVFQVRNTGGVRALVRVRCEEHFLRMSVEPDVPGRIVARTGGMGFTFGLADHGAPTDFHGLPRKTTELTGYSNENLGSGKPTTVRLVSNFVISPGRGVAVVNLEPRRKIVRVDADECAQGTVSGDTMPDLYYFFGSPEEIYRGFLEVRNRHGYRVFPPKYAMFGVGWEAWGALAWDTNERTVRENVNQYLDGGYPLSWMVIGSGFWPRADTNLHATTSFGMWDKNLYPSPTGLIKEFHQKGLKVLIGLRIAFIVDGPFAEAGVKRGFFIEEGGKPKVFEIAFPKKPVYLLDAHKPDALRWYVELCQRWLDDGVDGFKEDLFGYGKYVLLDDKIDPVNAALMRRGVYVMGRNGYLGSPMDLHRFEDFNWNQNQDRGPLNGLAFAYSGFPYVYPDIVGGTFKIEGMPPLSDAKLKLYFMRNAQYASVNPSMSMGFGPWRFQDEEVERVVLRAARLHARLHPYIYSAAMDAYASGFPHTMTPLPLQWPQDPEVYQLENTRRRGYQWMLGPSLLATPLYGDDYRTAESRDVYLPAGRWMDYDTGEILEGPRTLKNFKLPPGKTPLFVGGKGVVVERDLEQNRLMAVVYPVAPKNSTYQFIHPDGASRTQITTRFDGPQPSVLSVIDLTTGDAVDLKRDPITKAVSFAIQSGHDYEVTTTKHSKTP